MLSHQKKISMIGYSHILLSAGVTVAQWRLMAAAAQQQWQRVMAVSRGGRQEQWRALDMVGGGSNGNILLAMAT